MHSQESWGRVLFQEGLRGWVPSLLQDKVTAQWAVPGSLSPSYTRSASGLTVTSRGGGGQEKPSPGAAGMPFCLMGLSVCLVLSQPICSSSPTDSTLTAFVTARLSTQGCSPLGTREENPEARTHLGTSRRGWLVAGRSPFCVCISLVR